MLSFFRRIINSKVGVIVTLAVLAIIALAFAAGDVTGLRTTGMGGLSGNNVAKVDGDAISVATFKARVQTELEGFRQQQPTLDMNSFVAQGGADGTLQRLVTALAFQHFGEDQGMAVSKRSIDGELASIPGLQAANGSFDMATYQRLLSERHLTDPQVRSDIAQQIITERLTMPTIGASQVPVKLGLPYASLLLEKRSGEVAFVPASAMGSGPAPTDAELQAFYSRNTARYTVPERRIVRYALVTPDAVKAKATPTDAEVAQAYQAARAKYQPSEKRTVDSVVAADQATAATIAAKVKAGATVADAARTAGLEAASQSVDKATFTGATSPAIADAVFTAAKGALIGPVKAPLGYIVARVTAITAVPGKSLDQARGEIIAALTQRKSADQLGAIHDAIDDALGKTSTFDEVVADQKLAARATPALLRSGADPDNPTAKPDPAMAPILAAAFQAEEGDDPQLVTVSSDGSFAVVALGRVVPAAARPLAAVRADVARDFAADRARAAARRLAGTIVAKIGKGATLSAAMAGNGVALPAAKPLAASRAQLASNPRGAPPALVLMFSMAQGTAKMLEAPEQGGWFVVKLDRIDRGDASRNPGVVAATRADLGRLMGREYVDQFARAVRAAVGVKIDAAAVAGVKADLLGRSGSAGE